MISEELRAKLAGQALHAVVTALIAKEGSVVTTDAAKFAVDMTNALIKELERTQSKPKTLPIAPPGDIIRSP